MRHDIAIVLKIEYKDDAGYPVRIVEDIRYFGDIDEAEAFFSYMKGDEGKLVRANDGKRSEASNAAIRIDLQRHEGGAWKLVKRTATEFGRE